MTGRDQSEITPHGSASLAVRQLDGGIHRIERASLLCCVVAVIAASSAAQPASAPDVLRVAGRIAASQEWQGTIWITDDVSIDGATITVAAGTLIEFCGPATGAGPVLRFGGVRRPGRLVLVGEPDRPIRIRSREGTSRGRIDGSVGRSGESALTWRHVRFERLGKFTEALPGRRPRRVEPALLLSLDEPGGTLDIEACGFEQCAGVVIEGLETGLANVTRCQWTHPVEPVALEVRGTGRLAAAILENQLAGTVRIEGCVGRVQGNVVIGQGAALIVAGQHEGELAIEGNYVHNTTPRDEGGFAATFEDATARVEKNLFRGGTYVVARAARRMRDNVLIAAPQLEGMHVKASRTHHVVSELPRGAEFERNIVVGPAFSLVCTASRRSAAGRAAEPVDDIRIEHCVFDGREATGRAVHLNRGAREPVGASITACVFMGAGLCVYDEARGAGSVREFRRNACVPACTFDLARGTGAASAPVATGNEEISDIESLKLGGADLPADLDARAVQGGADAAVEAARGAYRPRQDSPLCRRAGRSSDERDYAIGAMEPRD